MPKGTIVTKEMITTKGPGNGISPMKFNKIIGKKTKIAIKTDKVIKEADIEW